MTCSRKTQTLIASVLSLALVLLFLHPPQVSQDIPQPFAAKVDILAPTTYSAQQYKWITETQRARHALFRCIEREDCAQNQTKVILIASWDFISYLQGGDIGGEAIWSLSMLQALKNMGYTVLFAHNMETLVPHYHIFANLVKMVIVSPEQADECFASTTCARSATNPAGIPVWKIFSQYFWRGPANPLGGKWTLSPEVYPGDSNTYVGYSIEAQCSRSPFIPHPQRHPQAYILAKYLKFFHPQSRAWAPDYFDAAANATGISFVMASINLPEGPFITPSDLSPSITNINSETTMNQAEFYHVLSTSVALVGVGDPVLSPTPYDALCFGIPFVNPIIEWDRNDPNNRTKWLTQHDGLKYLSAPHVYNVILGDRDRFVNAIRDAAMNPIQSYILGRMRMSSVEHRLGNIIEHDWQTEAAELLKSREAGFVSGAMFML
ncbi:hypothetical protein C8R47DRAFT_1141030 [Mycena vitilis]|nr:hypothetical protein C8R47DRAFT_1141030 [Mycena vitilis]